MQNKYAEVTPAISIRCGLPGFRMRRATWCRWQVRLAETVAGRRPDVIVCDYQLSRGMTGVDAIESLPQRVPDSSTSPDSSAPHQRRCEVRGRLPRMPPFVQARESGEVSRGAGRRLLEISNREQTRQSRSDALRTVQGIVLGRIIKVGRRARSVRR